MTEENEDYLKLKETIINVKEDMSFEIYAYCLMGNHLHLLLKEGKEDLTLMFKRIAGSYVYWYNWKYHRCGHLFQDRFKSEPVEDDSYFLTVLRYIHQNPVKAKLCKYAEDYPYSSMGEYITFPKLTETDFALSMLPMEQFLDYHREENEDQCLEISLDNRITDEEVKALILRLTNCKNVAEVQLLDRNVRNDCIQKLHKKGASIRQISRLTGLSKKIVERNV